MGGLDLFWFSHSPFLLILRRVAVWVIEAAQAVLQQYLVEIHQKSGGTAGELQIRNNLRLVNGIQRIDRLQLDDNTAFDQQVNFQAASQTTTLVDDGDTSFMFDEEALRFQFRNQALAINRFEQAWPKNPMYFDGASNHATGCLLDSVVRPNHKAL